MHAPNEFEIHHGVCMHACIQCICMHQNASHRIALPSLQTSLALQNATTTTTTTTMTDYHDIRTYMHACIHMHTKQQQKRLYSWCRRCGMFVKHYPYVLQICAVLFSSFLFLFLYFTSFDIYIAHQVHLKRVVN